MAFDSSLQVEIWKRVIDSQEHFNDIGMRIRALTLTATTLALSAAGLVYVHTSSIQVFGATVSPAAFVPLLGLIPTLAFWNLDVYWFYRLLRGAVEESKRLEQGLRSHGVSVRLNREISEMKPSAGKNLYILYGMLGAIQLIVSIAIVVVVPVASA